MKPYQTVAIAECQDPLVEIPADLARVEPHAYVALGAPYGSRSPFYVRREVCDRLLQAQQSLEALRPGWKIQIFDAYRPVAVQQFMVDYTFGQVVSAKGLPAETLTEDQQQTIWQEVYQFWAVPNADPALPPPHSTGAAIDITLVDDQGQPVEMGSPIDEISPRSIPNHFANSSDPVEQQYHQHRELLRQVMAIAGFKRHWNEWWHFSYGDQIWAWLCQQDGETSTTAKFGRV